MIKQEGKSLAGALQQLLKLSGGEKTPGVFVSVSCKGELLFEQGVGLANLDSNEEVTATTNFRMASVTKQFTAMGIALLAQSQALSFQSRLSDFFPELGMRGNKITLHHLLTHTSGLPDYEPLVDYSIIGQVSDAQVLHLLAAHPKVFFRPGTQFRYSNSGYVLLGLVIERVTGIAFADFLHHQIFSPLGIHHTSVYQSANPATPIPNRALGYASTPGGGFRLSDQSPFSATQGDGCLYTSGKEYRRWHQALHHSGPFALDALLQKVQAPVQKGKNWYYGMGWFFSLRRDGSPELYHTGNSSGFSHLVVRIPEEDVLVIAFSNLAYNTSLLSHLLPTILQSFPFKVESDLVWELPVLTR